ncbi:copper amine oxidase N-terminal domain-containing protein [Paenibacillus methanolicus]|uniref:Copper amine oxidase-like protein n=1 Tax=Paenibacillus methanolicus TaxID=582686 RepID=A0A5S5C458_9BACL|nr:copper amine oxidase N-terminal domain-containing protein [Paenibacillus methanolicus]TYP74114.1 copper amine oxidase-like protein [Paenibacillus methanolicus]
MKYKQLAIGALLGSMITGAGAVAASEGAAITAFLKNEIVFKFNGVEKKLDKGYSVLTYNNATYVPARFVAEEFGANVVWDNKTQTIQIITPSTPVKQTETKPNIEASDWDKFDGEWSNTDLTAKLDFVSASRTNVELKSTAKAEFNGMKFTLDDNGAGFPSGQASHNGNTYMIALNANGDGALLITIMNEATKHVYTGNLKGSTPLPASGNTGSANPSGGTYAGDVKDFQGKWKNDKRSLTLSFNGSAAKLVYDNETTTGLFNLAADVNITASGSGSTEITKDGSKYLVQLTLGMNQVSLTVINVTNGQFFTEVFTAKE